LEETSTQPLDKQNDAKEKATQKLSRFRWKTGLGVLILGTAGIASTWIWFAGDRTTQVVWLYKAGLPIVLVGFIWLVLMSGLRWRTRGGIVLATSLAILLSMALFRHEGFSGEFYPRFAFRWSPTREDRAEHFRKSQKPAVKTSAANVTTAPEGDDQSLQPLSISPEDWPQFRGPTRDGIVQNSSLLTDWKQTPPKQLWKHPVGPAWSSFAIVGNLAFTQEQWREEEAVVCYDLQTGQQIWSHVDTARFYNSMSGAGPRCTPTLFDSRLYALGATGILNCLNPRTGKRIWSTNILTDAQVNNAHWGMAGSPLVFDDVVVVNPGGGKGSGVVAYDRITGEKRWAAGNRAPGYVAPRLEVIGGVPQILVFGNKGLAGHDASNGRELWWFPWKNDTSNNCVEPILIDGDRIFLSTGYTKGSTLLKIREQQGEWTAEQTAWKEARRFKLKFNGGVLKDGIVYGLNEGVLACFDLSTGKQRWKRGRYGYGQLLLVDDILLIVSDSGKVALVEATPEKYREVARFQAIEGKTWNHPALSREFLVVRSAQEAACYKLPLR